MTGGGAEPAQFDVLRLPMLGRFLRLRHARTLMQAPLLAVGIVMIAHGLFGPNLAPKNLATLLAWVHYRGLLVLALLIAGNVFCMACPFMLPREAARTLLRRFGFAPRWNWPRRLRSKWLSLGLLIVVLYVYELFDLWGNPPGTAWLIVAYFGGALAVDSLFKHASFCKFVCPIGQFNFVVSTLSPLEIAVRDPKMCAACRTKDCIRGRRDDSSPLRVIQRGCELALFQPRKVGNVDCTFCLDCIHACPHDNIGIPLRVPGSELWIDTLRSGIGRFSQRKDLSALVVVFVFGALVNAFGMVSPVYAVEAWLAGHLHLKHEAPILGLLFATFLVVEPVLLLGAAAWTTRLATGRHESLTAIAGRYVFAMAPLGFGIWVAHYCFHFLTGLLTVIPVTHYAAAQMGLNLGAPAWHWVGLPVAQVRPLEYGFLALGYLGSLMVAMRLAELDAPKRAFRVFAPWAVICTLILGAALWLLSQPMEMRGVDLGAS